MNTSTASKTAVVLLSGGMDSATALAIAQSKGYACHALSFSYGQRHKSELEAAKIQAQRQDAINHIIYPLDLACFAGSALTDPSLNIPKGEVHPSDDIPITYVPARNTIFLSIALGLAEVIRAHSIFIGVTAVDYSGYPDCRPEFIQAFQAMANLATKEGIEGKGFKIRTPLIHLSKAEIIRTGIRLGVDYSETISCYDANAQGEACGHCDACRLRRLGFDQAQVPDNTRYQHS